MDANQINDIKVKDFTDVTLQSFTAETLNAIDDAKKLLKEHGYFVGNLWKTCDVTINYDCTEEEAQEVLEKALNYESVYELVWEGISYEAEDMNLKRRD